jgi:hypothetical protein
LSRGGWLFDLFLYNQVNILMTHIPNYSHERLAIFLFRNLFEFLSCWTNLKFYSLPPLGIVKKYFELHPHEKEPLWTVSKLKIKLDVFQHSFLLEFLFKQLFVKFMEKKRKRMQEITKNYYSRA